MKTQQELMQAYWGPGGTVDMVKEYNAKHGTNIQPWECVVHLSLIFGSGKVYHKQEFTEHPTFGNPGSYYIAITILYDDKRKEHRPVFAGSELYYKRDGSMITMVNGGTITNPDRWSWNPPKPKRTFKLNDLELPCPDKNKGGYQIALISSKHFFSDFHDAQKVANAIDEILTAARDKE